MGRAGRPCGKYAIPIHLVHIADGFPADCDKMVERCLQLKVVDFQDFAKIWKEMNFDLLYEGRSSGAELAELSEELVIIAKHYMVKNTSYFEESVTGLFLVYSLLNLQPFPRFACLRLVPSDVKAVNRIETVARRERRLDVLYILGEVLVKWTQYHAEERPHGMELVIRKYLEGCTTIDKLKVRPMGVFRRQNEELDHIKDFVTMSRQYVLAKAALANEGDKDPSLEYFDENMGIELNTSLRKLISGESVDGAGQQSVTDPPLEGKDKVVDDRSRTLQAIKSKAMSNAVDPLNHLTSAGDRIKSKMSSKTKSDLKAPIGKIKSGFHVKPVTTSPKKQKASVKPISKDLTDSDDDDPDLQIDQFHQICDDEEDSDTEVDSDDEDLQFIEFDQSSDSDNDDQDSSKDDNNESQCEQEGADIDIDLLPPVLKAGDLGQDIEIEIIDHKKPKRNNIELKTRTDEITKTRSKSTKKTKSSKGGEDKPLSINTGKNLLKTYKRDRQAELDELEDGFPLKKKEKRLQKRRDLHSRFKKIGMLAVANFGDEVKDT